MNIDSFAEGMARRIKKINSEETASIEVMKYGLLIFINFASIVTTSILISLIIGTFPETILVLFSFAILRALTGGYHLKSSASCIVVSTLIITVITLIPLNHSFFLLFNLLSILLILCFAPFGIENQSNVPKRYYPLLKWVSIVLVASNFLIKSDVLAVCFLAQSIMLIHLKGGDKYEKAS